jgi:hypothetical protein
LNTRLPIDIKQKCFRQRNQKDPGGLRFNLLLEKSTGTNSGGLVLFDLSDEKIFALYQ